MSMLAQQSFLFFFFNDTATTEIYTLSHTTLFRSHWWPQASVEVEDAARRSDHAVGGRLREALELLVVGHRDVGLRDPQQDRKSTRLNSSHVRISYAAFCLKKKKYYAVVKSDAACT